MPYETVKTIKNLNGTYGFQLEDNSIWSRFKLSYGERYDIYIQTTVANILENDGKVQRVVFKDYKFPVHLQSLGYDSYVITLHLTDEFLCGYAIKEGTPIHVFLNAVLRERGTLRIPIFNENEKGIMDIVPKNEVGEPLTFNDSLINIKTADDYYSNVILEINHAFFYKAPNATLVMLRKLFENLIVDLLTTGFGFGEVKLYYSIDNHRHLSLNQLIPNLKGKFRELTIFDEGFFREEDAFFRFLGEIKQYGDASAHVLSLERNMDRINHLKPDINRYGDRLIQLTHKIRLAKQAQTVTPK